MIPTHKIAVQLPRWRPNSDQFSREVYSTCFSPDAAVRGPVRDGRAYFLVVGEPDEPLLKKLGKYGTVICEEVAAAPQEGF